jgi:hypothetical protein
VLLRGEGADSSAPPGRASALAQAQENGAPDETRLTASIPIGTSPTTTYTAAQQTTDFGAARCMFESNFPVDKAMFTYPVLWNAFKRLAQGASAEEKALLFAGAASRFYRLEV